ncbi:hypothetical protein H9P43_005694 [Blastocladiella emersonii ATCC 22665]|nr:hypothetical protein H9P43_005694 [Blastocladiella emersonii ATCC 22665]
MPIGFALIGAIVVLGFASNHSLASWIWLFDFNVLDIFFKSGYGLYQRDFLARITFYFNLQQRAATSQEGDRRRRRRPWVRRFLRTVYRLRGELFYTFPDPAYEEEYVKYYHRRLLRRMRFTAVCGLLSQLVIVLVVAFSHLGRGTNANSAAEQATFLAMWPGLAHAAPYLPQWWVPYVQAAALNGVHLLVGAASVRVEALRGYALEGYLVLHSMASVILAVLLDTVMQSVTTNLILTQSTRHDNTPAPADASAVLSLFFETGTRRYFMLRRVVK